MQRVRNTDGFSPHTQYASTNEFLGSAIKTGYHTVKIGTGKLDFLVINRGAPATLVVFHSALSDSVLTTPVLQGRGISAKTGMNLLAVADPSIELGDINLAWYIGNRGTGPLRPILAPLIHHALSHIGSQRTILFGASGGGYAAASFGQEFPGSIVLAVNPRLDLAKRPAPKMVDYLRVCHQAMSSTPQQRIRSEFVTDNVADFYRDGLPFDLLLFQNTGDLVYTEHQARPFIEALRDDARLYTRMEYTGDGHTPIPSALLREILISLSDPDVIQSAAILKSGFAPHNVDDHARLPAVCSN